MDLQSLSRGNNIDAVGSVGRRQVNVWGAEPGE